MTDEEMRRQWFATLEQSRALLDRPPPEPSNDLFRPDALEKWAAGMPPKPEEPTRDLVYKKIDDVHEVERPSEPPIDVHAEIAAAVETAIEAERAFMTDLLAELHADLQARANDDLERATRMLTCELAELRATLGELRATIATERIERTGGPLDLPRLPRGDLN